MSMEVSDGLFDYMRRSKRSWNQKASPRGSKLNSKDVVDLRLSTSNIEVCI